MRSAKGNNEVVAPSSAPRLEMVACPVRLSARVPGRLEIRMEVGPSGRVEVAGNVGDEFIGRVPAPHVAGKVAGDWFGIEQLQVRPGLVLDRVRPAAPDRAGPQPAGVGRV